MTAGLLVLRKRALARVECDCRERIVLRKCSSGFSKGFVAWSSLVASIRYSADIEGFVDCQTVRLSLSWSAGPTSSRRVAVWISCTDSKSLTDGKDERSYLLDSFYSITPDARGGSRIGIVEGRQVSEPTGISRSVRHMTRVHLHVFFLSPLILLSYHAFSLFVPPLRRWNRMAPFWGTQLLHPGMAGQDR